MLSSFTSLVLDGTRKMYDLYVKECQQKGKWAVKHHKYREIFCNEYNLSFHVPKKDQCINCNDYNMKKEAGAWIRSMNFRCFIMISSFTSLVLDGTVSSLFPLQSIVHSFNANTKGCNKKNFLQTRTDFPSTANLYLLVTKRFQPKIPEQLFKYT
jgi:hypothetical protein